MRVDTYPRAYITYKEGMLVVDTKAYGNHENIIITHFTNSIQVRADKIMVDDLTRFMSISDESSNQKYQEHLEKYKDAYEGNPISEHTKEIGWPWNKQTFTFLESNTWHPKFKQRHHVLYETNNYLIISNNLQAQS